MKRIYFITSVLLFITWAISFFAWKAGTAIHCMPVIAGVFYLQGVICNPCQKTRKESVNNEEEQRLSIYQQSL
jgi:hypothetical protein